jgi:predicted nucleic acid-binding protein
VTGTTFLGSHAVFVDTSGLVALLADRDGRHADARMVQARLVRDRMQLVTTNFVLAEMHALLLVRVGRGHAIRSLLGIDRSDTVVVRVAEEDERRAREILVRYDDKDFTLVDATSFAVMERLGITEAFTFDHHFVQFGLRVLGLEM